MFVQFLKKTLKPDLLISCNDSKQIIANKFYKLFMNALAFRKFYWSQVFIFHKKYLQSMCWQL